jgi:tetratricopeptide (TPR) repeat protein
LSAALENDPRFMDAQLLRGFARLQKKDFVGAYADFEALTEQLPDGRATAGLAQVYAVLRAEFRQAAVIYQRAVDEGCRTAAVYNNLGFCLFTDGQLPEAAEALEKATALNPDFSAPWHTLARIELLKSMQEGRLPELGAIEKALRLGPETAELYMDAAVLYAARGRPASDGRDNQAVSRTFELLGKAVDLGLTREHLAAVVSLDETLKSDKRWHDLDSRARSGPAVSQAVLLLDLMPELLTAPRQARAVERR